MDLASITLRGRRGGNGPWARRVAVFVDPEGQSATALGVCAAPALLWVTTAPEVAGVVERWEPPAWRDLLDRLARKFGVDPSAPASARRPRSVPGPRPSSGVAATEMTS